MPGKFLNIPFVQTNQLVMVDMRDSYTCSFAEFLPFCNKLYYFSNFKDFNTFIQDFNSYKRIRSGCYRCQVLAIRIVNSDPLIEYPLYRQPGSSLKMSEGL